MAARFSPLLESASAACRFGPKICLTQSSVTARAIGERSADEHGAQETAATGNFRQGLIVLHHVGVHRFGGIQA